MILNEDRKLVAARLRNYDNLRESFREAPICAFLDVLGVGYLDWKGVCNCLADLIEPPTELERICLIKETCSDEFAIYDYLSCGHVNLRHHHEPTSYCSTCGAKVVKE
jgi:hypothetical protein